MKVDEIIRIAINMSMKPLSKPFKYIHLSHLLSVLEGKSDFYYLQKHVPSKVPNLENHNADLHDRVLQTIQYKLY